jgi:CheY-like chemotaxis protein
MDGRNSGQPVRKAALVAQTGWGQEEDRRRSNEVGFDHHFTKPMDPTALQAFLASLESAE